MGTTARRRREQARARRRQQGAARPRGDDLDARARFEENREHVDATMDPDVPPAEAAAALLAIYGDDLPPTGLAHTIEAGVDGRAAAICEEIRRLAPESLAAVSL
ncbi:MAG TPA: hypothetical protein VID47_03095, partial [Actinomycetota bacterium]